MRILWVKVGGLWPLNTGGRLRSFHILAELARRHRVTLLTTHGPGDDPEGLAARLPECERVVSVPHAIPKHRSPRFLLAVARSWLSPLPVDVWKCRVPALAAEVSRRVAARDADVCVVDFLAATPNAPLRGPVPAVLFAHNVEHVIWKRLSQVETRPLGCQFSAYCQRRSKASWTTSSASAGEALSIERAKRTRRGASSPTTRANAASSPAATATIKSRSAAMLRRSCGWSGSTPDLPTAADDHWRGGGGR